MTKKLQFTVGKGLLIGGLTGAMVSGSSFSMPPEPGTHGTTRCSSGVINILKKLSRETLVSRTEIPLWESRIISVAGTSDGPSHVFRSQIDSSLTLTADPMSWTHFLNFAQDRENHGMWVLFTPSSESDRFQTGHISVFIKGHIYTRSQGPGWDRLLQNLSPRELEGGKDNWNRTTALTFPYGLAQYFELPTPVVEKLSQFFSERVWHFYMGTGYRIGYRIRPHQRLDSMQAVTSENCTTFAFSYLYPRWLNQRPDLVHSGVPQAFGEFPINPNPTHQVFLNTTAAPYRGSVLISRDGNGLDIQRVAEDLHAELQAP